MFHKIKASIAEAYDERGEFIPPAKRKHQQVELSIYSKDKSKALTKAGKKLGAAGFSHNGMEIM
jgi:hypothetical protein